MKNLSEKCPRYETCSASLCPLDRERLKARVWYPGDEICKLTPAPSWVRMQRKIAKKARDKNKYFTYEMLKRNCRISNAIIGLDPDRDETSQLKKWFTLHPPKKELSNLEKKIIARRFKKAREKNKK